MTKILVEDLARLRDSLKKHADDTAKQYEAVQITLDLIEGRPFGSYNTIDKPITTALVKASPAPRSIHHPASTGKRPKTWKHTREEVLDAALSLQQPCRKPQICEALGIAGKDFESIHAHVHELMTRGYAKRVGPGLYVFTRK